jgi:hypothetical protein
LALILPTTTSTPLSYPATIQLQLSSHQIASRIPKIRFITLAMALSLFSTALAAAIAAAAVTAGVAARAEAVEKLVFLD